MSNNVNTEIIERAMELAEECTNSMLGAQLERAIEDNDVELMYTLSRAAERHLQYTETMNDEVQ